MKQLMFLIVALFLMLGLLSILVLKGIIRFNYPSKNKYPIVGVDVSHHQGVIDWEAISKQDIKFAFIKATEGKSFKDKRFDENVKNAISNGIDVGAYHFFTFISSIKMIKPKNNVNALKGVE